MAPRDGDRHVGFRRRLRAWTARDDRGDLAEQLNDHLERNRLDADDGRTRPPRPRQRSNRPTDGHGGTATMTNRIAIDVGGTFTDVVRLDPDGGLRFEKVPTTPTEPTRGVLAAFDRAEAPLDDTSMFTHGTTLGTERPADPHRSVDRGRRDEGVPRRLPPRPHRPRGQLQHLLPQAVGARRSGPTPTRSTSGCCSTVPCTVASTRSRLGRSPPRSATAATAPSRSPSSTPTPTPTTSRR